MEFHWEANGDLILHNSSLIKEIEKRNRIEKFYDKPMIQNLRWNEDSVPLTNIRPLQKKVGEASYVAGQTRPEMAYPVNRVSRKVHCGTKETMRVTNRILGYAAKYPDHGILVKKTEQGIKWVLEGYSDSSFADLPDENYKSTGGYCIYLNKSLIDWKSKKIKLTCNSTAEAEYVALYNAAKKTTAYGRIVKDFHGKDVWPATMYIDNKAVYELLTKNSDTNLRKHMGTKYFCLQDWLNNGLIKLELIKSEDNVSDLMTKQVDPTTWDRLIKRLVQPRGSVVLEQQSDRKNDQDEYKENGQVVKSMEARRKIQHVVAC